AESAVAARVLNTETRIKTLPVLCYPASALLSSSAVADWSPLIYPCHVLALLAGSARAGNGVLVAGISIRVSLCVLDTLIGEQV
ncbi:uncharacterized, partial [Tachysurus ichikawai]